MAAPDEYLTLREKVDGFTADVSERRADAMRCGKGCTACCEVSLSVSEVEASAVREALSGLPAEAREAIRRRAAAYGDTDRASCVMLEADGACAVYAGRPLICRTQGLPLSYPEGMIPEEAVMARGGAREITWCPLNFEADAPLGEDVIDDARIQEILALVNRRYCDQSGIDPLERIDLIELAAGASEAR